MSARKQEKLRPTLAVSLDAALERKSAREETPGRAELLARRFHEAYERLAPSHGYKTRTESAVPWDQVPENNRKLMIAVAAEVWTSAGAAMSANVLRPPDEDCAHCRRPRWPGIDHYDCDIILGLQARIADLERELAVTRNSYDSLRRAVNESADDCSEECTSYGHREDCKTHDPATWLIALQARAERAECDLAAAQKIAEGYEQRLTQAVELADKAVARAERAEETIRAWQLAHEKAVTLLQDALLCRERAEADSARLREALVTIRRLLSKMLTHAPLSSGAQAHLSHVIGRIDAAMAAAEQGP